MFNFKKKDMALNIYCPSELPEHQQVICDNYFPGGATEKVIFHANATTTDYSDGAQIQADIDAGRASLVSNISGEFPEAGDKVQNDRVTNEEILLGFDQMFNWEDWNVTASNVTFYDELNVFVAKAILVFEPLNDGVGRTSLVEARIRFKVKRVKPVANSEFDRFVGSATWSGLAMPVIGDVPAGIFDQAVGA